MNVKILKLCTTFLFGAIAFAMSCSELEEGYWIGGSGGNGGKDTAPVIDIPAIPTGVLATALSSDSIKISWDSVSGATAYYVYRSASANGTYTRVRVVRDATSTSYIDTELSANTTYYYKVSAYNNAGESPQSREASATTREVIPNAPSGVSATTESTSSIIISWNVVANATGYYIYRSETFYGTYTQIGTTLTTSYTDTDLPSSTVYYYRVAAYNSEGTGSQSRTVGGNTEITQFNSTITYGSLTDSRDGKTYRTVTIGTQIWMAENLNYETDNGSWCYNNETSFCDIYGRLYDWATAMDIENRCNNVAAINCGATVGDPHHRGICPNGWHLPSEDEWNILVGAVGSDAGTKLKSASRWRGGDGAFASRNESGFSALPGGFRDGVFVYYDALTIDGAWWTTAEIANHIGGLRLMYHDNTNVLAHMRSKRDGLSIRCVKDD